MNHLKAWGGMRIYFIRHGESEANILRELSTRGIKHGLTEKGRSQITRLAAELASVPRIRIYSSPLLRATESAEILRKKLGCEISVSKALCEWDVGELEGRRDDEAWERYWQIWKDWSAENTDSRVKGGESFKDIEARFVPFVTALVAAASSDESLLLIGHAGLFCAALPLILRNVDSHFAQSNGITNAAYVLAEMVDGELICKKWGEITLL